MENTMKYLLVIPLYLLFFVLPIFAQEIDCDVSINTQQVPAEARENLVDFAQQIKQYLNSYQWTKENLGGEKIKCSIDISFLGSPKDNHYTAQAFIGSQRPIYKSERSTAVLRVLDDKWEFDYIRYQPLSHNDFRFDPLLSFLDFYVYLILGFDFDTYRIADGTQYFQKAIEIVNKARGTSNAGTGWDISSQSTYQRGQLVEEILNPKFRDLREAVYKYHYKGLDLLYKNPSKATKNIFSALEKIGNLQTKINQRSLAMRVFFDTKYLEIAEVFLNNEDHSIYPKLAKIDPSHQKSYEEYSKKNR
jgi:hypothetical protein